jgi:DNA-binding CsgD family transcriptional regulator
MGTRSFTIARDELTAATREPLTGEEACEVVARAINLVASYDAGALMSTDPETQLPAGGVVTGFDPSACEPFWDNELLDPDFNKFNDLAKRVEPIATLADATDGEVERSPRFQKLYSGFGAADELRAAFMSGSTCLAIGAFVRVGHLFSPTEVSDVRNLLVPAVAVLRGALAAPDAVAEQGPVVILLDGQNNVVSTSEGALPLLEDLRISVDAGIPGTILVAATRARASRSATRLSTRLRGSSGRWVRLHVTAMDGDAGLVAVTIDRASASDLVPILLASYGLTGRETEVVLALCRGLATKEIATELGISTHTVRDHLKVVFAKTGINSRGELVARLFSEHVLTRFEHRVVRIESRQAS